MKHHCMWSRCEREVPRSMWGCRGRWYSLPNNLRALIVRTYRYVIDTGTHATLSYVEAHRAALAWIREHETHAHE